MKLMFLGTGAGVPSASRNVSAVALDLVAENGAIWLFDAGEGTQQQLLKAGLGLRRITRVFITHLHGDHLFGLPGLLSTRSFQAGAPPLDVYGPPGLGEYLGTVLRVSASHLTYDLTIHEVADGETAFHATGFTVTCRLLDHVVPSFGYRVTEDERPGALQVERLRALGLGPGRWYGQLKAGQTVTFPDGRVVDGRDYCGPGQPGRIVAILGDTRPAASAVELARGADVLVHESTYGPADAALAPPYFHSTCLDAAAIARAAGVRTLLITHFSARYSDRDLDELADAARQVFPATFAMRDFQVVDVNRQSLA